MEKNSDSEYEYEEAVVLVELNGIIDSNFLLQEQTPTKILGIDTEQPILQLGHYIFSGEYEDTLGTIIAYEPITATNNEGKEIENYKFVCKTDKKLSMKRIFLQEKEVVKADESKEDSDMTKKFTALDTKGNTEDVSNMDCSDSISNTDANKK